MKAKENDTNITDCCFEGSANDFHYLKLLKKLNLVSIEEINY